ncbi:MAG: PAS domain-containing protein, partial [Alkalispirochaetaceae bacterium]
MEGGVEPTKEFYVDDPEARFTFSNLPTGNNESMQEPLHYSRAAGLNVEALLSTLLDSTRGGVMLWDEEGPLLLANRRAGELLGYSQTSELEELNCWTLDSWERHGILPAARRVLAGEARKEELLIPAGTAQLGSVLWLAIEIVSVAYAEGKVGLLTLINDRTEEKEAKAILDNVTQHIDEVVWVRSRERTLYVSPGYQRIWQRTPDSLYENPDSFVESIHPEDREALLGGLGEGNFEGTYRILRPDGSSRSIRARHSLIPGEGVGGERYVGVARDVTEETGRSPEGELKERLLSAAAAATAELLVAKELNIGVQRGLTLLGEATGVDRVYLFENSYDEQGNGYCSQRFEWNSGAKEPQIDNRDLQDLPFAEIPELIDAIRTNDA